MARDDCSSQDQMPPGYRVEAPRASDAIGLALRDAYERDVSMGVPDDMASILRQLNAVGFDAR
jgi:hypothetical protein